MSRRGWVLFLSLSLIWGIPYLLIRVAVESLEPFFVVFCRVLIASAILIPIAAFRGEFKQLKGHWLWVAVFAIVEITLTWPALNYAETRLSSSFTALIIASVPLVGAIIAWRRRLDVFTGPRLLGLLIGFAGVAALVGLDFGSINPPSVALLVITVIGYAFGPVIISQHLSEVPSIAVIAAALAINTIIFAPMAWIQRPTGVDLPAKAWWSVVVLGAVCTAVAFVFFFALVAEVGPARTTVITFMNPLVALVLGILVLSEPITTGILVGFPMVLLGSWMATRKGNPIEAEPAPS